MRTPALASIMLLAIVVAGGMRLSPWFVPLAAVPMTITYVWQKRQLWRASLLAFGAGHTALGLPVTYLIQCVVTGVFFLLPFGIAAAITGEGVSGSFGTRELIALAVAALGCAGAVLSDRDLAPHEIESGYEDLIDRCIALGSGPVAMPADIFALARDFADRPDPDLTLAILQSTVVDDESRFVRCVAQTAIRFVGRRDSQTADVHAMVMRGLEDEDAWVRYDAVWAGQVRGFSDAAFRERVAEIADGMDASPVDAHAQGAEENARLRAAGLLAKLGSPGA